MLGLPLEERKRLQDEAVAADNSAWEGELDVKNRDKSLTNPQNNGIIDTEDKKIKIAESKDVHYIGKIDKNLYKVITDDITTDEVIITDNQIQHIKERHPNDYERYSSYIPEIISNPDYILEDKNLNTALILKEIVDVNEQFQLILRLHTSNDIQGRKNSIITYLNINKSRYEQYVRNKKILYAVDKKE